MIFCPPIRIQGKLTSARPTQNMKRMMRMVRAQHTALSSISTPASLVVTSPAMSPMMRVTRPVDVIMILRRPNL